MNKLENIWSIITSYQVGIFNGWWWRDIKHKVSSFFFPRQKWLISKVPNRWADKEVVMEICIFECIKHFVEGEEGLKDQETNAKSPGYPECQKIFEKEMLEMYQLITIRLPSLEEALNRAYDKIPPWVGNSEKQPINYEEVYGPINALEKELDDLKTKIMLWAVNNRRAMWT